MDVAVVEPQYDHAESLRNGFARVEVDGRTEEIAIPPPPTSDC
jgi:hypothetical protein